VISSKHEGVFIILELYDEAVEMFADQKRLTQINADVISVIGVHVDSGNAK